MQRFEANSKVLFFFLGNEELIGLLSLPVPFRLVLISCFARVKGTDYLICFEIRYDDAINFFLGKGTNLIFILRYVY